MKRLNKYIVNNKNISKNIKIISLADIHLSETFNNKDLDYIVNVINKEKPNYIFLNGDILDTVKFIYSRIDLRKLYINFIKKISKNIKIFITLGSHDYKYDNSKIVDFDSGFWEEVNSLKNVYVSHYNDYYEDDIIRVDLLELSSKYYLNAEKYNDEIIEKIKTVDNNKFNILVNHSPVRMLDKDVINKLNNFNLILSGHTHLGVIPLNLDKIIPGHRGIISPSKKWFPNNVRGKINIDNSKTLIINGGFTKLSHSSGLRYFNFLFPKEIDIIEIRCSNEK